MFDSGTKSITISKAPWFIQDKPRFEYRGLLLGKFQSVSLTKIPEFTLCEFLDYDFILTSCLPCFFFVFFFFQILNSDTSRHYYPIDVIKQIIESMSYAKLVRYINISDFLLKLSVRRHFNYMIVYF